VRIAYLSLTGEMRRSGFAWTFASAVVSVSTVTEKERRTRDTQEIPILILLLSPAPRHESDSLVRGVCTTRADGGSPSAWLRPPF
jgi:hypothetical protein